METFVGYLLIALGIGVGVYGKHRYSVMLNTGRKGGVQLSLYIAAAALLVLAGHDLSQTDNKNCISDGVRTVCAINTKD